MTLDEPILNVHRSWWNFSGHLLFAWLIFPLAVAFWQKASQRVLVFDDRVVLEKGILTTDVRIIFIKDIRSIDIHQTFFQRVCSYGDLMISTSGTAGIEYIATGIPTPLHIKDVILTQRSRERFLA